MDTPKLDFLVREVPPEYDPIISAANFIRIENTDFVQAIIRNSLAEGFEPEEGGTGVLLSSHNFSPEDILKIRSGVALSEVGKIIQSAARNGTVLDLASGGYGSPLEWLGEYMGAKRFVGVDLAIRSQNPNRDGFPVHYIGDDLLRTVARMPDDIIDVTNISGFESHSIGREVNERYARALEKELSRVMRKGAILMLDQVTFYDSPLNPENVGFAVVPINREDWMDPYHLYSNEKMAPTK